jgi:hypothetical protein
VVTSFERRRDLSQCTDGLLTPTYLLNPASETVRAKSREVLVLGILAPVGGPEQILGETLRRGDPTFAQLTRAREYTRRMNEEGELRGSRLAKVADFFRRNPH